MGIAKKPKAERKTGFVYLLTNPAMPGLVKIGMTSRTPARRLRELNATTALPFPFKLIGSVSTPNAAGLEKAVHERLSESRANRRREFFRLPARDAMKVIEEESSRVGARVRRGGRADGTGPRKGRRSRRSSADMMRLLILCVAAAAATEYMRPGTLRGIESLFKSIAAAFGLN